MVNSVRDRFRVNVRVKDQWVSPLMGRGKFVFWKGESVFAM